MPAKWIATQEVQIDDLTRFPGNARRGDVHAIARSLYRNGQYRALVVRAHEGTQTILAGNHTRDALELLYGGWLPDGAKGPGWSQRPRAARCELIECSDNEARRINLADNRLSDIAEDDDQALAELLAALDGDLDGTGWDVYDIDGIADKLGDDNPGDAPEDKLPEAFGVIVECDTEQQQARLLTQLDSEGFRVRTLMA